MNSRYLEDVLLSRQVFLGQLLSSTSALPLLSPKSHNVRTGRRCGALVFGYGTLWTSGMHQSFYKEALLQLRRVSKWICYLIDSILCVSGFLCCVLWLVLTQGQTHITDTAQHRFTQHNHNYSFILNVVVSSMIHDNMFVYFP